MELKGKNAIVTGAARGIGRGIALKLAEAGANVALVDLGNPKDPALTYNLAAHGDLASAVDEVKSRGVKAAAILADVTRLGRLRADGRRDRQGAWARSTSWSTMPASSRPVRWRSFPRRRGTA